MNTLIVMDYNAGFVHCYTTYKNMYDDDWEDTIERLGFKLDEVEWMITPEQYPFEFHHEEIK